MEPRTAARSLHLNLGGRISLRSRISDIWSQDQGISVARRSLVSQVDIAHTMCTSLSAMNSTVIRSALVPRLMKSITTAMARREKVVSQF